MAAVAVFDHGKTNLKLSLVGSDGSVLASVARPTPSRAGPPYGHADLAAIEDWLLDALARIADGHPIDAVVATAHGSAGVLVDERGPILPMLDYEETVPEAIDDAYRCIKPPYAEAGSGILGGATHLARQLLWLETGWPAAVAQARHFLPLPQYWAWRLSGVAALELTSLGAQSHLWDARAGRFTPIVEERGWARLMPAIRGAWESLGPVRAEVGRAARLGPSTEVLCGIHDSSASFYRWQRAGFGAFTLLSTGTWIVGLRSGLDPGALVEARSMTANLDVEGNPIAGILTMTGREREHLAGKDAGGADEAALSRLVANGTMALPSFAAFAGAFPGSAGRGRVIGPDPGGPGARAALGILYASLVADACLDFLEARGIVILDGGLVADPAFGGLVAALRPQDEILVDGLGNGTTQGAALLRTHGRDDARSTVARTTAVRADPLLVPGLAAYRDRWRQGADGQDIKRAAEE
jgi:sugar (pentulose or hexulose) kinase